MKLRTLVMAMVVIVAFALPSAAQQEEKFDLTPEMRTILDNLRIQPLTQNICTVHERYAASKRLQKNVQDKPELLKLLSLTQKELDLVRLAEARRLAASISQILEYDFPRSGKCSYDVFVGPFTTHVHSSLDSNDDYELVRAMTSLIETWSKAGLYDGSEEIAAPYEIDRALANYAINEGPKLVKAWLEKTAKGESAYPETLALWRLLAQGWVSPSLIQGLTPQLLFEVMDQHGRKKDGEIPSLFQLFR